MAGCGRANSARSLFVETADGEGCRTAPEEYACDQREDLMGD